MNVTHVHLALTHFPVVGIVGAVLLLARALLRKSEEVRRLALGQIRHTEIRDAAMLETEKD